jgi:DNA-binding transcriptional LysR family regulator
MDLWQLNIFCKVVELKSFSKAGKTVHLSQPTISSHIKDLEDHFGCRLIDRLSREALPTKAGSLLYDYAQRLITLRDEIEIAMAEFHGSIKGRLVIGGSTIPGGYILPRIVGIFTQAYPEVTIALKIGDTKEIINGAISGTLEMGVVGARSDDKNIVQEKLIEDRMCIAVPFDHKWADKIKVPLNQVLKEPFIVREQGSGTLKSIQQSLTQTGYGMEDFNISAEMGSTAAVIQGIKNKVGISILSAIAINEELQAGILKALSIDGLNLNRRFYLTRHKYRSISPICRVFIEFLKTNIADGKALNGNGRSNA